MANGPRRSRPKVFQRGNVGMKPFPSFFTTDADRVKLAPDANMQGFVFDGSGGVQIVFWQCPDGGVQPEQVHDFWEYALVVEGTFDGEVGGMSASSRRARATPAGTARATAPSTPSAPTASTGQISADGEIPEFPFGSEAPPRLRIGKPCRLPGAQENGRTRRTARRV